MILSCVASRGIALSRALFLPAHRKGNQKQLLESSLVSTGAAIQPSLYPRHTVQMQKKIPQSTTS